MGWTKRKPSTLPLLVSAILLLSTANAVRSLTAGLTRSRNAIRSLTAEKDHYLKDSDRWTEKATDHRLPTGGCNTEKPADGSPEMNDFEENCNSVDDGEECLMRRKVAAHVDYVYTQQHNP